MSRDDEVLDVLRRHADRQRAHDDWHAAGGEAPCAWCGYDLDLTAATIAMRAQMPRRSARRALARLVDAGQVEETVDVSPPGYRDVARFRACEMVAAPSGSTARPETRTETKPQ
jgi:hypothetical protein